MGIEPTSEAWEASILPLYDARSSLAVDYTQLRDSQYRLATVARHSFAHCCREDRLYTRPAVRSVLNDRLYLQRRDSSFGLLKVGQHPYLHDQGRTARFRWCLGF